MPVRYDPRKRITEGVTASRLKMEASRAAAPSTVFLASVAAAVAVAAYLFASISETFGRDTYEVRFAVEQNYGVFEGFDDVRFRGVPAGTITGVERDGARLIVVATIKEESGVVYKDARAQIRPITPLNDVYLDVVDPGTPDAGPADPDVPLEESQTETSVTVPDVLNIFDEDVRVSTAKILDDLGNGMDDRGAKLRDAFVSLGPFLRKASTLTDEVAVRKRATSRLIRNSALLTTELGRREVELKRLLETGAATVGTLGAERGALDRTLAELGPTVTELRASLASVRGVVDDVDTGVRSLYPVADELDDALSSLRELDGTLSPAVSSLRRPVRTLVPWVKDLDQVAERLRPTASALRPQVPTLNRVTQRLVDCEDGVIGFFQWNTSLSKFGDQNAPIPRGNLAFGVPGVGLPGEKLREPIQACAPGRPVRGVPTPEDLR